MGYSWYLFHAPGLNLWISNKTFYQSGQVQVKLSTWYLITAPDLPGLPPFADSELTMSLGGIIPTKGDLSLPIMESEGIKGVPVESPKGVTHTILKGEGTTSIHCTPDMDQEPTLG